MTPPLIARPATFRSAARKPSSAKALAALKYSLSANSPAMKKISPANLLLVRPAVYLTMHWPKPASIVRRLTSPMLSSISNGNRVANAGFIKNPMPERLPLAVHGWKPRLAWLSQKLLFVSALPPRRLYWAQNSESANNAVSSLSQLWRLTSWRQFIRLQFCAPPMMKPGTRKSDGSLMI